MELLIFSKRNQLQGSDDYSQLTRNVDNTVSLLQDLCEYDD